MVVNKDVGAVGDCRVYLKNNLYHKRQVDAVVQIAKPEEVGEPVRDVEGTELFITKIQKSQNTDVVLIASVKL